MRFRALVGAAILGLWPQAAEAVPVIDQSFHGPGDFRATGITFNTSPSADSAQTFTVGISGSLSGVGLWLSRCCSPPLDPGPMEPLEIQIRRTVDGAPSPDPGDLLASGEISAADIVAGDGSLPTWFELDLTAPPLVTAGDQLALVLVRYPVPNPVFDYGAYFAYGAQSFLGDAYHPLMYGGGKSWYRNGDGPWLAQDDHDPSLLWDIYFATWVDVPEPSLFLSTALGLGLVALRRAARRGRRSCT